MWKVTVIESERGWGQRIDSVEKFNTYEEAKKFQIDFNAENNKDHVPDWYMSAHNPVFDSTAIDKKLLNK